MVEPQPSKLVTRVRFPLPAPFLCPCSSAGQSNGLLSRGSGVRIPPGTPLLFRTNMVGVAQVARAPDCGSGGRGFKSHHPPHKKIIGASPSGKAPVFGTGISLVRIQPPQPILDIRSSKFEIRLRRPNLEFRVLIH